MWKQICITICIITVVGCSPVSIEHSNKMTSQEVTLIELSSSKELLVLSVVKDRVSKPSPDAIPFCDAANVIKEIPNRYTLYDLMIKYYPEGFRRCQGSSSPEDSSVNFETLKQLTDVLPQCNKGKVQAIIGSLTEQKAQAILKECMQFLVEQELQK